MNIAGNETAYWYKMLDYWINNQNNSGLTLPFLVGAQSRFHLSFQPVDSCIRDLLKSIVYGPAFEDCVSLKYCGNIEAYILGLEPRPVLQRPYFTNREGEATLTIVENTFSHDSTIEEIADFLETMYLPIILTGTYSRQRTAFGGWSSFNSDDNEQIDMSLSE